VTPDATEALQRHVSPQTAALLAERMTARDLTPDEALVGAGWPSTVLYLVLDGALDVVLEEVEGRVLVGHIGADTWVGEAGFLDRRGATATVLATAPTHLLALPRSDFDELCTHHPAAASDLLRALTELLASRILASSSGLLEEVSDHTFTLTHPAVTAGPFKRLLASLFGGHSNG